MPPSITGWTRLEPRPRAPSIAPTLAARIRDPLWLLARQWQVGEFRGEDAGSPAWAEVSASSSAFTGWMPEGDPARRPITAGDPLEDLVESEPFTPDLTLRVELGQLLERLLGERKVPGKVVQAIRAAYPLPPLPGEPPGAPLFTVPLTSRKSLDARKLTSTMVTAFKRGKVMLSPRATITVVERSAWWTIDDADYGRRYVVRWTPPATTLGVWLDAPPELEGDREAARFRQLCAGRVIDGYPIYRAAAARLPIMPSAALGGVIAAARVADALAGLVSWVRDVYGEVGAGDPPAWKPERLEHRLAAVAIAPDGGEATLAACPGRTGAFDWYTFDLEDLRPGAGAVDTRRFSVIPGHVTFRGAPQRRWWNFEAGTTPVGEIQPDRRDVAKLVLMDFLLVHGNDWFLVPLDQRVGTLCRIDALIVHDVFGLETLVERADAQPAAPGELWTLFSTAVAGARDEVAPFFMLPPSAADAAQPGTTVEEVRFLRDEMANVVFGVEERAENGVGEPWPGHERDQARRAARGAPPPVTAAGDPPPPLRYLIQTPVPESWIPFPPVVVDPSSGRVRLERSYMQRRAGPFPDVLPVGRILRPSSIPGGRPYRIFEEEVPREGLRVTRRPVRARWTDGSTASGSPGGRRSGPARARADSATTSRCPPDVRPTRPDDPVDCCSISQFMGRPRRAVALLDVLISSRALS